jgi:DNA-binding NtrC family response regulator
MVERLLLLSADGIVSESAVKTTLPAGPGTARERIGSATGTLAERVQAFERDMVLAELDRHGNRVTPAAKALGLERSHLYKKCQQLGIDLHSLRKEE